jgi:hypothetical protein
LRLRLLKAEVTKLLEQGRVEEKIQFAPSGDATLVYALEHQCSAVFMTLYYSSREILVILPTTEAETWARSEQVGICARLDFGGNRTLEVIVEKDFACLDLSDAENVDTFPNPNTSARC